MVAKAVMTAMIMPITICGGPPGGSLKANTRMTRPIPDTVPRAIPPSRAPIRMQARRMQSSIQIMIPHPWAARRMLPASSVSLKQLLDFRCGARFQQCQHQQNPRLLRIQFVGSHKAHLIIVYLDVASDGSRHNAAASDDHHSLSWQPALQLPERLCSYCRCRRPQSRCP